MLTGWCERASRDFTVQNKTLRHRFTSAIALIALIFTITMMAAPRSITQKVVSDNYGADYLILNPEMD